MVRILLILFIFSICACKHGGSDSNSGVITDPALLPPGAIAIIDGIPICEFGDHSCMDGTFGVPLTKKQCESLQDWQLGDPDVYYFSIIKKTGPTESYIQIISTGAVIKQYNPHLGEYWDIEMKGLMGMGHEIEKNCRCQVNFDNNLVSSVLVEPRSSNVSEEQIELCATKEL